MLNITACKNTSFERKTITLIHHYVIFYIPPRSLLLNIYDKLKRKGEMDSDNGHSRKEDPFVIAPESVIFIKSEDNYVMIHYPDRNHVKKFALRSSMRALEEDLLRHGLARCHRSYFINPPFHKKWSAGMRQVSSLQI